MQSQWNFVSIELIQIAGSELGGPKTCIHIKLCSEMVKYLRCNVDLDMSQGLGY